MMAEQHILLVYRDIITEDTVRFLLDLSELKLKMLVGEKKLRKRVFNILVECLQNIVNHADQGVRDKASIIVLGMKDSRLFIRTGNVIRNSDIEEFELKLNAVNKTGISNIRSTYNMELSLAEFSVKGGAGLGLLDIRRRSGNTIYHDIQHIDEQSSFLSLYVEVQGDQH